MNADKLRHALESAFTVIRERSSNEEICIICPVPGCHDKTGNRNVNVKRLTTHCYRCEGKQPGHVTALFRLVGLEFEDQHVLEPTELLELLRTKPKKPLTPVQEVDLPGGFQLLDQNRSSIYWRSIKEMAERKNLAIEDLEEAQAGFTREGPWEPFCIFPVIEGPRIVYYQGRTYHDDSDRTKKFPSKAEVPYGASYWVYNIDALENEKTEIVVLVESILNVLSLRKRFRELNLPHITPICIFTHFLTPAQVAKVRRYKHVKDWCILFDSDSTHMAEKTGLSLGTVLPVTVARMPKGLNADGTVRETNDANDDVDNAVLAIDARTKPNAFNATLRKPHPLDRPRRLAAAK